jgi:hypothetical protein
MKNQAPNELKGIRAFLRQLRERIRELIRGLSPLQRQTLKRLWVIVMVMSSAGCVFTTIDKGGNGTKAHATFYTLLMAISIFAILITLGRYLAQETDEFIRMIVVKALLWGVAVSTAVDAILSTVQVWCGDVGLMPGLQMWSNFYFFLMGAMFSVVIQLRRNR